MDVKSIMVEWVFRHCRPISITSTSTVSLSTSTTKVFERKNDSDQPVCTAHMFSERPLMVIRRPETGCPGRSQ